MCDLRLESGLPTVCSETCVGRIRYIGVTLYDTDKIAEAASVQDEKRLHDAQLDAYDLRGGCGFTDGNGCSSGASPGKLFGGRKFVAPKEGWQ